MCSLEEEGDVIDYEINDELDKAEIDKIRVRRLHLSIVCVCKIPNLGDLFRRSVGVEMSKLEAYLAMRPIEEEHGSYDENGAVLNCHGVM